MIICKNAYSANIPLISAQENYILSQANVIKF